MQFQNFVKNKSVVGPENLNLPYTFHFSTMVKEIILRGSLLIWGTVHNMQFTSNCCLILGTLY